jgi:hypothetical protein
MAVSWPNYSITWGTRDPHQILDPQTIKDLLDLASGHPERIALRFQAPMSMLLATDFDVYRKAVKLCNNAGIAIMLTCKRFPDSGPASPSEMLAFATKLATLFDGKHGNGIMQGVDLGNEDNRYSDFARPGGMADMMILCYPALKNINPDLLVIPSSTLNRAAGAMHDAVLKFLQKAGHFTDGINIHTYFGSVPPSGPHTPQDESVPSAPGFVNYVKLIRDACVGAGFPDMDIYDSECGFPISAVNHGGVPIFTEADQSKHLLFCIKNARELGLKHISIFTLGYASNPDGMSLVKAGGVRTQAFKDIKAHIAQFPSWSSAPHGDPPPDPGAGQPTPGQIAAAVADIVAARKAWAAQWQSVDSKLQDALIQLQPSS